MHIKTLLPTAFAVAASAQSLTEAIGSQNASLSSLIALLGTQTELVDTLGSASNITILAPNNDALAAFLNSTAGASAAADTSLVAQLLSYHVLNGTYPAAAVTNKTNFIPTLLTNETLTNVTGGQVVGAILQGENVTFSSGLLTVSTVTTGDVTFDGGVIHIIDTVLTIPVSDSETAVAANLTSLAGALTSADLVETVDTLSDVTIFAPSNDAFAAIGSATGNLSTEALSGILTYHVVQGTVGYSSILTNTTLETVNGGSVTITIINGEVFVNSAKVLIPDVLVSNGVVHVIDGVLNPDNSSAAPNPSTTAPAFPGASSGSDVPFTSGAPTASNTIPSSVVAGATSTSSTGGAAAQAVQTGAVGLGMLFGGAALLMN